MPAKQDPTIRNIIARYLSPENNRDLDILAATTGAARGKKITRQQMAAELIIEGLKAHTINLTGGGSPPEPDGMPGPFISANNPTGRRAGGIGE